MKRRWLRWRKRIGLALCSVGIHDPREAIGVDVACETTTIVTLAYCGRGCGQAHTVLGVERETRLATT